MQVMGLFLVLVWLFEVSGHFQGGSIKDGAPAGVRPWPQKRRVCGILAGDEINESPRCLH